MGDSDVHLHVILEKIPTVSTPTISPNGGYFPAGTKAVTLACDTLGATIRYTIDGSEPSSSNGISYNDPFNITIPDTPVVVKAIGVKTNFSDSLIEEATFFVPLIATILVEGGTFTRESNQVTVSSFHMGEYEVTQSQWKTVMGSDKQTYDYGSGDDFPVYYMTWYDAVDFCNALSLKEGLEPCYTGSGASTACDFTKNGYRLPMEAEWEYAAREGLQNSIIFTHSGSNTIDEVAWYSTNSEGKTHAVGTKVPNALGLYDMTGNVYEWCWDWYDTYPSGASVDPTGATGGDFCVMRGGSFNNNDNNCQVANRNNNSPGNSNNNGFHVLRVSAPCSSRAKVLEPENSLFGATQTKYLPCLACFSRRRKTKLGSF